MTDDKILQKILDGQDKLSNEVGQLKSGQDKITKEVVQLKNGQNEIKGNIKTLSENIKVLNEDVKDLGQQITKIETNLTRRIDKLGLQIAGLEDDAPTVEEFDNLEKRVAKLENNSIKN